MKFLCTGDLHIGRRPSWLPTTPDPRRFSASAIWSSIVDLAIAERVDAVVLTGDVVDQANRFFEAYGPLEREIRRLGERGIETFAVAGNHDFEVLPRLAGNLDGKHFHLLGRGGRWERFDFQRDGCCVHLDGWSFPSARVARNPLAEYDLPRNRDAPVLGILHADVDQAGSPYAPVPLADLQGRPLSIWLLGHIHQPSLKEGPGCSPVLYPGSPQPLDPGETGRRGVSLVEIDPGGKASAAFRCTATVRYEPVEVDLTGAETREQIETRILEALRARSGDVAGDAERLQHLCCRLDLRGRTKLHGYLEEELSGRLEDLELQGDGFTTHVEKVEYATVPDIELESLARRDDAPGILAGVLIDLQSGAETAAGTKLVQAALQRMKQVRQASPYRLALDAAGGVHDHKAAQELLLRQGRLLLAKLLAQKEDG